MKTLIRVAACMAALGAAGGSHAVGVPGQGTWETTLQGRDLDGNLTNGAEAYYDTALNITWLRDANANSPQTWDVANTWANNLVVGPYSDWRLPNFNGNVTDICSFGFNGANCGWNVATGSSDIAHLFYVTLANVSSFTTAGVAKPGVATVDWGLVNTGPFINLFSGVYWLGTTQLRSSSDPAYHFGLEDGRQILNEPFDANGPFILGAMAVHPGDIGTALNVPEPQAYALMLAGLGAVAWASRRRSRRV